VRRSFLTIAALSGVLATSLTTLPTDAHATAASHRSGAVTTLTTHIPGQSEAMTAARHLRHLVGTLTGVVVGADGRPLVGACVTAIGAPGRATTMTRADGRYVLGGLRHGRYLLRYAACASEQQPSWHAAPASQSSVPAVVVAPGVKNMPTMTLPVVGQPSGRRITATASDTGQIRGVVTGNGHPVGGVCVAASPRNGFGQTTTTSANGHYTLRNLPAGRYLVEFVADFFGCRNPGNWLSQWYKGVTTPFFTDKATVVRVAKGEITRGINASLRRGGQISGTVRSKSGRPLKGICVAVEGRVAGGFTLATPRTGKLGRYVAHGLFKGSYVVGFKVGCGSSGNFAPQWWRHASTERAATHIRVPGTRKVSGIDATLAPGSAIAGVVHARSLSGPRLRGICVDASNFRTGVSAEGRTNRNGDYKLIGLSAGTYFVQYQTGCGNRGNYLEFERKVTLAKGQTKRGVDVALQPGAGVSGTVMNNHGKPVGGICVDINRPRRSSFGIETNPDGTYKATGLTPGVYTVQFSGGCGNRGSYLPQYYNGKTMQATADPVKLIAGHITTGIDATMQAGATIAGTLTDAAGHRLSDVCVGIDTRSDQFLSGDGVFTDIEFTTNGAYRASKPASRRLRCQLWLRHRVRCQPLVQVTQDHKGADLVSARAGQVTSGIGGSISGPERTQWWKNAGSAAAATVITVGAGTAVTGIDAALKR
jgi:Carboxypeptidase regulatory-like domain